MARKLIKAGGFYLAYEVTSTLALAAPVANAAMLATVVLLSRCP